MVIDDEFLNAKQVAAVLKVSEDHVYRLFRIPEAKGGVFARKYGRGKGFWRIPAKRFYERTGLKGA